MPSICKLAIKAKPGAKTSRLDELPDGPGWVATLKYPPVDGKANAELIALVADYFGCRKADVTFRRGAAARMKLVQIHP